jgi:diaminopimelate decarboxylase
LNAIFEVIDQFLTLFPHITTVNLGGGLGVPQKEGDQPLDVEKWATIVGAYVQKRHLSLCIEPGDYLVKDAGLLITQVNTLEHKRGQLFVGLDTGMNMNYEPAYYNMNLEPVPLQQVMDGQIIKGYLAGNINEPIDLLSSYRILPPVQEGDYLALINTGGYGASPSSDHCMRGDFEEYVLYNKVK